MACITTKHGKTGNPLLRRRQKPAAERRKADKVMREGMEGFLLLLQLENGWIPSDLRRAFHSVLEDAELKKSRSRHASYLRQQPTQSRPVGLMR